MHGVCAVSSDKGPCACHASRTLRRACGQGAVLSLCMVRPGSGRFGVGFWVGFWVGLRARDFPTERVLSRTPLIIRTVGFWVGFWVGLRARDFPTRRVLSRTPLIIRTVDKKPLLVGPPSCTSPFTSRQSHHVSSPYFKQLILGPG